MSAVLYSQAIDWMGGVRMVDAIAIDDQWCVHIIPDVQNVAITHRPTGLRVGTFDLLALDVLRDAAAPLPVLTIGGELRVRGESPPDAEAIVTEWMSAVAARVAQVAHPLFVRQFVSPDSPILEGIV